MGPLAFVALLLGISGVWAVREAVEAVNDRILAASARAISEAVAVERQAIVLEIPPSAFAMLENSSRDNVYYNVVHNDHVISGYDDLPTISPDIADGETRFGTAIFRDQEVRIVAEARRLPQADGLIVVQVAETIQARQRLLRPVLWALATIEGGLILLGVILMPLAVRWGLRPLARLRGEIDSRKATDTRPLPLSDVPTELLDLVRGFNDMLKKRDDAVQRMRRFTADASHQMRTPLSILRAHISVLQQHELHQDQAVQSVQDISDASRRLQQLLTQLLALARAEDAGATTAHLELVDLGEITRSVAAEIAPQAFAAGVDLDISAGIGEAHIKANVGLLNELLTNLIDNAIKYNRKDGWVYISVSCSLGMAIVAIEDEGPGISVADRPRAFERFVRLGDRNDSAGSGLGLAIAGALADTMNARIVLADRASGPGLRVEVHFPLTERRVGDRSMSAKKE